MRLSRRHKMRDQTRSAAATASVATSTAAIVLTASPRMRSGRGPGIVVHRGQDDALLTDQHHAGHASTAAALIRLLPNSTSPRAPNTRRRPARGEMREKSGMMRSGTMRGAAWATEATTPASASSATTGQRKSAGGGGERAGQRQRVLAARDPPAGGVVEDSDQPGEQRGGAARDDEDERDQGRRQRGEQRRLARKRDLRLFRPRRAAASRSAPRSCPRDRRRRSSAHRLHGSPAWPSGRATPPRPRRRGELDLVARRHAEDDVGDRLARLGDLPRRAPRRRRPVRLRPAAVRARASTTAPCCGSPRRCRAAP